MEESTFTKDVMKLSPIIGKKKAYRLLSLYLAGDEKARKRIQELIDAIKAAFLSRSENPDMIVFEPPPKEDVEGDIYLGDVIYAGVKMYPLKLTRRHLLSHVGIFGSTGYGKTNVVQHLVIQLAKLGIPVVVFDFSKRNYRDLLQIPELKSKIRVFTLGRNVVPFKFNPLVPPEGVAFSQWMKEFAEIFDHAYWMMGGGRHIVLKALDELAEKAKREIRLKDIRMWIYANESEFRSARERNWAATAKRALDSLCFREVGEMFDVATGITPDTFFSEPTITILELDGLTSNDRTFVIEIMLQWMRDYLLTTGERESSRGMVVLEEAHHLLNREKTRKLGMENVMDVVFREIRELGIGIIYTDQHPSMISYTALGNTSTQIYMNLGLETKQASDVEDASSMLNLEDENERNMLRRLPVGCALMFCRMLNFTKPFLIHFPKVELKKGETNDGDIVKHMKSCFTRIWRDDMCGTADSHATTKHHADKLRALLNSKQLKILERVYCYEAAKASEIYKPLGLSGTTFKRESSVLMENGLLKFEKLKIDGQTSHVYFLPKHAREACSNIFNVKIESKTLDLSTVSEFFSENGYEVIELDENHALLQKNSKLIRIHFLSTLDEKKIHALMEKIHNKAYILVSDRRVRSALLQNLASLKNEGRVDKMLFKINQEERLLNGVKAERVEL